MKELKVQPIRNGTVIDHVHPGTALKVLRILNMPRPGSTSTVTLAMNVPSKQAVGRKDILKIEDRELDPSEVSKIALIAPNATINIVRDYEVTKKEVVRLPQKVTSLLKCPNPNCVTNHEPVKSSFFVVTSDPVRLRCEYCDREVSELADHVQ